MKKLLLTTTAVLIFAAASFAQKGERSERIKSLRIAFITEKLSLTPEESQNFWPVYNELNEQLMIIKTNEFRKNKMSELTDSEAEILIKKRFDNEQKMLDLKRAHFEKLKQVLPVRKIAMLHRAEKQFKKRLLDRVGNRRRMMRE